MLIINGARKQSKSNSVLQLQGFQRFLELSILENMEEWTLSTNPLTSLQSFQVEQQRFTKMLLSHITSLSTEKKSTQHQQ